MPKLTFWFEFASTYSYVSALRIEPLARSAGVDLEWKPFLLGPIFAAQGLTTSPFNAFPVKGRYMWRDLERECDKYDLPVARKPAEFPQNGLIAARVATLGAGQSWGPDFVRGMYLAQFVEHKPIAEMQTVADVLNGLGLEGTTVLEQVQTDQSIKDALRHATEEAQSLGIFGAPSFTTKGDELFWGNDRLDDALAWAKKAI